MTVFRKTLILWLCVSIFCFQLPCTSSTALAGVTATKPEIISSAEEDIPVEEAQPSKKGGGKWLWALLGAALIGGVAAMAGGGGDGGGDDGGDNGSDSTGSVGGSW